MRIDHYKVEKFLNSVLDRYQTLTSLGIYPFEMTEVEAWVNNFTTHEHRFLAANMLDRLIFRSRKMAKEAYHSFLVSTVRDIFYKFNKREPEIINQWLHNLSVPNEYFKGRFAVAPIRLSDDSGASGDTVCRLVGTHTSYTKALTKDGFSGQESEYFPTGYVILLVDDLLGGGTQISKFNNAVNLERWSENNLIIYAPLMAMESGLSSAIDEHPHIAIEPLEVIESSQKFFSFENNANFVGHQDFKEEFIREIYLDLMKTNSLSTHNCFGRDDAALTLSFEWGCPNQTLGALWWTPKPKTHQRWSNLFERRG